jgi:glycosyltransferase involved in cell wall biosynthesis
MDALLDRIRRAPSIVEVLSMTDELLLSAARSEHPARDRGALVEASCSTTDAPTAIAAVHALGRLAGPGPEERLSDLIRADGDWLTPHAAWALARRPPRAELVPPLVELVAKGRLAGMLAQWTLARWAGDRPETVARELTARLEDDLAAVGRARLVETLGLVPGDGSMLATIAADSNEPAEVRVAAFAALGDRADPPLSLVQAVARGDGPVADAARLATFDILRPAARPMDAGGGALRVAQVHLGGRLDRTLLHAGEGDTGGVATLLVQLGDALARDDRVETVTTVGRGPAGEALASLEVGPPAGVDGSSHAVIPVPLGRHEGSSFADPWPARVAAERGLRRILRSRPASVLHLRMADVGSLVASGIAWRQGVPTVFTLAPDPHAVIAEMERSGELDRASFGPADARDALWLRAWLVGRLARTAEQVALFPRPELAARLRDLVGIDVGTDPGRYHVIPEGIDLAPVRAARADVLSGRSTAVLADLRAGVTALGPSRLGLPVAVSVGRLLDVKGMARIAEAFATDPGLRDRANLVIVGGDLDDPSPAERAEIDRIEATLVAHPELAESLVMLGHRPHDDVMRVLAVARHGLGSEIAPGGAYVCGSRKEEFGLAIVEALATGLPVVAPRAGGPASYVQDGVTGRLVDTLDQGELIAGIAGALDLAELPSRARRAELLVEERFTIRAMADALVPIYAAAGSAQPPWATRAAGEDALQEEAVKDGVLAFA